RPPLDSNVVLKKITASFGGERLSRQRFLGGLAFKRFSMPSAEAVFELPCAKAQRIKPATR
ncbi:MAG: hypothetical protein IJC63_00190, partial [Myxococcaceae bacterium]|nr:hypothetical protein [Myxococcaceae bacterium]